MTVFRVGLVVRFWAAVAPPALFEIAFCSSSGTAAQALAGEPEEIRALRERLADPLAVLTPSQFGRLLRAAREAGAS